MNLLIALPNARCIYNSFSSRLLLYLCASNLLLVFAVLLRHCYLFSMLHSQAAGQPAHHPQNTPTGAPQQQPANSQPRTKSKFTADYDDEVP